jgi:threonine synthase
MSTSVSGLQVPLLLDAAGATAAVREYGGHAVEVDDEEIAAAQRLLARQDGLLVEPADATALAGLLADARAGRTGPEDRAVVLLTGAGHKDAAALDRLAAAPVEPDIPDLAELVARLGQPR